MQKLIRNGISILLALLLIIPAVLTAYAAADLPPQNTATRHTLCTALSASAAAYYTGDCRYEALSRLSGASDNSRSDLAMQDNPLYSALHELMASTHTYSCTYSGYKPGSLAYYWASTDAVDGSDSYIMFYTDIPAGEGIQLNREHIWPKSRASFSQKGGGADLHHLRPAIDSVNMAKSDHLFGNINGVYESGVTVGEVNGEVFYYVHKENDLFECKDDVKGDVARILLYVYCRWEQPNLYSLVEDGLPALDDDDKANNGKPVIESLDTLLSWCAADPVDTWEMTRNDLTEQVQGNRNVFIDYPELAWQLFGLEAPLDMPTPSHAGDDPVMVILLGDVDGDGDVTILDATAIQRKLARMEPSVYIEAAADADEDGDVTILDATAIQRLLARMPSNDHIGKPIV